MTATIAPFNFAEWADSERYNFEPSARDFLSAVESPAEAWFAYEFVRGASVTYGRIGNTTMATVGNVTVGLQCLLAGFRPDVVVSTPRLVLVVEIDGAFHNERRDYDYQKDRIFVRAGAIPIRFTALEAIYGAHKCWREIGEILASWGRHTR